ncbi:MAG: leucine--tRNA ligase [Gemmatimonadetes bacterium]|nr:leucine--tRNA ligase [Gemmatimonadota bacterium]
MTDRDDAYDPQAVEEKWQRLWVERRTHVTDLKSAKEPYYNLMMFPYPSAEGLHVGNAFAFIGADINGRVQRLQGKNVFEPMGFDAFGIHSENFAMQRNTHPARLIPANISQFQRQLKRLGLMLNWEHELSTTDPDYYKWTQWIFLQLHKAGLAFRKKAAVNWCPECKTVLANEQVINGFCERHPTVAVTQKFLEQWFFAITKYAERLLKNLETLDWSASTRVAQENWIGRSVGAEIRFKAPTGGEVTVFTTRPDTVFGATFLVLAPEHPLVESVTGQECRADVNAYRRKAAAMDVVTRRVGSKEKTGVFTGGYAKNPATGENVPIWIADYVLMGYGTGAIMGVPAHDERDFEFATKYKLPIVQVVDGGAEKTELPFSASDGKLVNSGKFNGVSCDDAIPAITTWLAEKKLGTLQVQYKLHDWCISRQRYWGPPIPVIYCDACGIVPVPEKDLPVILPLIEDYRPDDSGVSPLARHEEWYRVPCPTCGKMGRRETDVSDTFLDSAWYFLRYPSTGFKDKAFDPATTKRWLPVNSYIGGNEHAVLHLMYSRFTTMVLKDLGLLDFEEPYVRFRAHGTIVKDGNKMSKSRGNVVIPDNFVAQWGADTFRMYMMFLGPYQVGGDFRDEGISGIRRFLDKLWGAVAAADKKKNPADFEATRRKVHQAIRKITADMVELRYNTAIAALMECLNVLRAECGEGGVPAELVEPMVILISPLAPHFAEECWERLGHKTSVVDATWPAFDEALAREDEVELVVQVNGKVRGRLKVARGISQDDAVKLALADEGVKRFIEAKPVRKAVYVENKLVSLVV